VRRVYSARNLPEAHLVLHLLDHAGIRARVVRENLLGAVGEIPFPEVYPEVWIEREHDTARALCIVRDFECASDEPGTHECDRCHEENPRNFQLCWSCGHTIVAI
jgi:Putative prokaryotic signal transducing protein